MATYSIAECRTPPALGERDLDLRWKLGMGRAVRPGRDPVCIESGRSQLAMKLRSLSSSVAAIVVALFVHGAASASVVLSYTGNNFDSLSVSGTSSYPEYNFADHVTVSLELSTALAANFDGYVTPLSFLMEDGINSLSQANVTNSYFRFSTDAAGAITAWHVGGQLDLAPDAVFTLNTINYDFGGCLVRQDFGDYLICGEGSTAVNCESFGTRYYRTRGAVYQNPGTWVSAVPEPSTLPLMLVGLGALAGVAGVRRPRLGSR